MSDDQYSFLYGYCPKCGAQGVSRERRPDGNDHCANGHIYPSRLATVQPAPTYHHNIDLTEENKPCPFVVLVDTRLKTNPGAFFQFIRVSNGVLIVTQYDAADPQRQQTVQFACSTVADLRRWCLALEIPCDNLEVFKT